jgi:hypothetical protein
MELRYLGFDQHANIRTYRFDRMVKGEPAARILISADLDLFRKHQVSLQEGPGLCARKLSAAPPVGPEGGHELTNEDLLGFANHRAALELRRANIRRIGARRRHNAEGAARPGTG